MTGHFMAHLKKPPFRAKVYALTTTLLVLMWLFRGAHEEGHALAAYQLGIPGHVEFYWSIARFYYPPVSITPMQALIVSLAGGMAVAVLYGWFFSAVHVLAKYCPQDSLLPFSFCLMANGLSNLFYSISEIWNWTTYGALIGFVLGFGIALAVHGKRLWYWLELE